MTVAEPVIQSAGPPPERHADRVIAAMMRHLAQSRASIPAAIVKAIATSKDGSARAQQRMAKRIRRAGAVDVYLESGSRGRYRLAFFELCGWDPSRDAEIREGEAVPPKPWAAVLITVFSDRGRSRKTVPLLFISHHALSRCAQRFDEVRTVDEVIATTMAIFDAMRGLAPTPEELFDVESPPRGYRAVIERDDRHGNAADPMVVVLRRHESRHALVATTVLFDREDDEEVSHGHN